MDIFKELGKKLSDDFIYILNSADPQAPKPITSGRIIFHFIQFCNENGIEGILNSNNIEGIGKIIFTNHTDESIVTADAAELIISSRALIESEGKLQEFNSLVAGEA